MSAVACRRCGVFQPSEESMKSILAAIALATATLVASATPVTLTGYQFGTAPTGTMTVNPSGLFNNQSITTSVSGLTGTVTEMDPILGEKFDSTVVLCCVEILAPTAACHAAAEYNVNTNPALSMYGQPFTSLQLSRLSNLFAKSFDTTFNIGGNDATQSAGTQLA